jgi:ketosteroid isomerase-like protein
MSERDVAQRFVDALGRLERDGDVEGLVEVFAEGCSLGNTASHREFRGRDEVRLFWREYRGSFGEVRSHFRNVIAADGRVALEWSTEGTAPDGSSIRYGGVSILETDGDRIRRFHAYFDPRRLGSQLYESNRPSA